MRRVLRLAVALAFALCATLSTGCLAPVIPVPPPSVNALSPPDAQGFIVISGMARSSAFVTAVNSRTEQGVVGRATATGAFTLPPLAVQIGDQVDVFQTVGTNSGMFQTLVVPATTGGSDP